MVYRTGADNAVADLLSRSEAEPSHDTLQETAALTDIFIRTVFSNAALDGLNLTYVAETTTADDELSMVVKRSINGWIPADRRNRILGIYNRLADELSVADGVLFRGDQAVIPTNLPQQVLQLAHEGHHGIVKMRQRLRDCVWWPGINEDVELHVKHCQACLLSDKSARPVTPPLHSIPFPPKPWHTVALDIKGELHGEVSRWRYLIVAYDLHSKWPEVQAVNTVTSSAVISFLE